MKKDEYMDENPAHPDAPPVDDYKNRKVSDNLMKYFKAVVDLDASDLHLKAGAVPRVRVTGRVRPTKSEPLTDEQIEAMVMPLLSEQQKGYLHAHGAIDLAYELEGSDRFRVNIFRQRGRLSVAARRVPRNIPEFEDLHLPPVVKQIAGYHQGLVLASGITGSGKSTTLAAMIEHINRNRSCHIVTIEDPIEFLFSDKKAFINQREVGIDVATFDDALRYLMREDPDVVLIGEMRDKETFAAALRAAETGHLVFATVHASSTYQSITRILELFTSEERPLARQSLCFNLRAIVCLKLMPCIAEGIDRIPATEIMLNTPTVRKMLEEERDSEIAEIVRSSPHEGMLDFNTSLQTLIEKEMVDPRVAYDFSSNPDELKMRLKGISAGGTGSVRG